MKLKQVVLGMLAFFGTIVLVACGTQTAKSADFQQFVPDQMDIRNHIEYQGDKITLMTTETIILYTALGVDTPDAAEEWMRSQGAEAWDGVEGITHEVDYQEDRLIEKTTVDLTVIDFAKLGELMPIETTDGEQATFLSYSMNRENFLNQGFTEIQNGQFEELP
ncbi:DUF1307 domain-containing protein [Streptococcus suis]